jgi:hypothetical protein
MRYGSLSDHFTGIVAKRLSAVEADTERSNQHEFNGTVQLRQLLGVERIDRRMARFIWLGGENEGITDDAPITWYDARESHPFRSEWRLYFQSNAVTEAASAGDLLVVARRPGGDLMFIVAPNGSTLQNQIAWLFGLDHGLGVGFRYEGFEGESDRGLDFVSNYVLEEIGIEPEEPDAERLDEIITRFGTQFPTSRHFSALARASLAEVDPRDDADAALLAWVELEEALFRRLERHIVAARLEAGFLANGAADVDSFLQFSLSVQNRRKSRMGLSLENHVEAILQSLGIRHARGARTEGNSKPDFLFPGSAEYADPAFDAARLSMLGVKSTLKDRWRQVLAEAARIDRKHLLTLEPGLSTHQTDEMVRQSLQLVVPQGLHTTFTPEQSAWLMNLRSFIYLVAARASA